MKEHALERLTAYLDGELADAERALLETHLRECAACSQALDEWTALDAAARRLEVVAPEGYFDAFPGRLRGRLMGQPRRALRRPAVWASAAAAAVLLAVLTPALLRLRAPDSSRVPLSQTVADVDERAPLPSEAAARSLQDQPRSDSAPATRTRKAAPEAQRPATAGSLDALARREAAASEERSVMRDKQQGRVAELEPARVESREGHARESARHNASPNDAAATPAPAELAETVTVEPDQALRQDRAAASPNVVAAQPVSKGRRAAEAAGAGGPSSLSVAGGAKESKAETSSSRSRYESLLARSGASADEARELREAWRAYLSEQPASPWADEARVRMIEAGAAAYRLGRDPQDLLALRRDAAAYLKLDEAPQKKRVLELLSSSGSE